MTISERLFRILDERGMSQRQLSRMTGISNKTISAWHKLGTNPGADKIMVICEALEITPEMLLTGAGYDTAGASERDAQADDVQENGMREHQPLEHDKREHAADLMNPQIEVIWEHHLIEQYRGFSEEKKRRLMAFVNMLENTKE